MNEELEPMKVNNKGRTWADVFVSTSYIFAGTIFLIGFAIGCYLILGDVPTWFFIAVFASSIFIPFLMERAKDDAELILVTDGPFQLTEYRVGRRVGLEIEGRGVQFQSKSGVFRQILTHLDPINKTAIGSQFANATQIDQVRDMTTLSKTVETLQNTLKESRISAQTVGVEVEKQSIEIVDWALKTIYGAIIPTEVSEGFGVEEVNKKLNVEDGLEELGGLAE